MNSEFQMAALWRGHSHGCSLIRGLSQAQFHWGT